VKRKGCDRHHFFVDAPALQQGTCCILSAAVVFSGGNLQDERISVAIGGLWGTAMARRREGLFPSRHTQQWQTQNGQDVHEDPSA
ncbi:MAG: hypothetical protein ABJN42_17095, partial [Roseibium sp.]|uniref:hypothetical protein n=1 Tax=Roseibium sp. TaxID=1936156 RepID=UPI0032977F17